MELSKVTAVVLETFRLHCSFLFSSLTFLVLSLVDQ